MRTRRRPHREPVFSFDSFLDLVTNVVGIIIRLILVVWVGARSYSSLPTFVPEEESEPPQAAQVEPLPALEDPLQQELARQRGELAEAEARLVEQLRQLDLLREESRQEEDQFLSLGSKRKDLEQTRSKLDQVKDQKEKTAQEMAAALTELQKRRERLTADLQSLEKLPALKKTLRYRTPVSQPVRAEESHFECFAGRVTWVNMDPMLEDIRRDMEEKGKQLKTQWQVTGVTDPAGAFRLRYTIERQRNSLDAAFDPGSPDSRTNYSYGVSEWQVEPVSFIRGETLDQALLPKSEFHHIVDGLVPDQSVVTLWVYPDSFPLYRQLRDLLADRGITVAGRPLPDGVPISCSRRGTRSRGQ